MQFLSSCSDNGEYPQFCFQAANDSQIYSTFRKNPIYTSVVETVSKDAGQQYFQMALSKYPELKNYLSKFVSSEKVGSPDIFPYKKDFFSKKYFFSPTTLRYINVLSDLLQFFDSLNGMRIVEIGGGYGGLCKIICDFCKIKSYTLIDLSPCLQLSKKFLDEFYITNVEYLTVEELNIDFQYDLVISNYAFSEIRREIQDIYMKKILQKSPRGYLLCNFKTHTWEDSQISSKDFKNMIKEVIYFKNYPVLSQLDVACGIELLIWGNI